MGKNKMSAVLWDIKEENRKSLPDDFLIKRTLVYGGAFLVRDILHKYGLNRAKTVFRSLKISEVGERRYNFLKNYIFI